MAIPVSQKQIDFFNNLLNEKEFPPDKTEDELRAQFAQLNKASGSEWIEKAMKLPEKGTVKEPITAPSF
jgi:hypothetical protein